MQSSSSAKQKRPIDMGCVMLLMSFMGYPCDIGIKHNRGRGTLTVGGLCYGLAYTNSLQLNQFEQRRHLLAELYYELESESKDYFIKTVYFNNIYSNHESMLIRNESILLKKMQEHSSPTALHLYLIYNEKDPEKDYMIQFNQHLKNKFNTLLATYGSNELDLRAYFNTIMQFQQKIASAEMQTTGTQMASRYASHLLSPELKDANKTVYFSHPLLSIVDNKSLAIMLDELDSSLAKYPIIKRFKGSITFIVSGGAYSDEYEDLDSEDSEDDYSDLNLKHSHTIEVIYNPSQKGNKWSLISTSPLDLIRPTSTKEVASEILKEFSHQKNYTGSLRGLFFTPVTLSQGIDLSLTGAINNYMQSKNFIKLFDINQILDPQNPNKIRLSLYKDIIDLFSREVTEQQVRQFFSIAHNNIILTSDFGVSSPLDNKAVELSVIETVLIYRFFEPGTVDVLNTLVACGAKLNHNILTKIGNTLPFVFRNLSTISDEHIHAATEIIQWLTDKKCDLNSRFDIFSDSNEDNPTLLGYFVRALLSRRYGSNANYLIDLMEVALLHGSKPNLLMDLPDFKGNNSLLMFLTYELLNNIEKDNTIGKDAILKCMKLLIAYGGKWTDSELESNKVDFDKCEKIFNSEGITPSSVSIATPKSAHPPISSDATSPTSTASSASTTTTTSVTPTVSSTSSTSSSSSQNADDEYVKIMKQLVEDKDFLKGRSTHHKVGFLGEKIKPDARPDIVKDIKRIFAKNLNNSQEEAKEIKELIKARIQKIKDGKATSDDDDDTIAFMCSATSLENLSERYVQPMIPSKQMSMNKGST